MRQIRLLLALVLLVGALGVACAKVKLTIVGVGFDVFYRARTLVPVAVRIENPDKTVTGEFRLTTPENDDALGSDSYRIPATIPRGARQLRFFYFVPRSFARNVKVTFIARNEVLAEHTFTRCQELYDNERLLVVVDSTGTQLSYLNGLPLTGTPETPMPRPWDLGANLQLNSGRHMPPGGYAGGTPTPGQIQCAYVTDLRLLPPNPEAYGSVATLALMSSVTENALPGDAQQALPAWAANGGHLLIAGGGVDARLQAPFFARLAPPRTSVEERINVDNGRASTFRYGSGRVTWLHYDPAAVPSSNTASLARFYGKLIGAEPAVPLALQLREGLNAATMVRNLRPPNLHLIIAFLLVYLVLLVPVNYFILKRLDKRELAWVTTPAIVLVFTFAAYGIGYLTKGNRLVMNLVSVVETMGGQADAEATSQLLVFSPSRTSYRVDLGASALVVRDAAHAEETNYYRGRREVREDPLSLSATPDGLVVERLHVNMWAFRQLVMSHTLDLNRGIYATLPAPARHGAAPVPTGAITNGTPYAFTLCDLYENGSYVASFSMIPNQRVDLAQVAAAPRVKVNADAQHMLDSLRGQFKGSLTHGGRLATGYVLVGYSVDPRARIPLKISDRPPTTAMTVVVVHL